ncbi:MAG: hypothetical protein ABIR55_06230 [Burkholderiaceae bacterium]
MILRRLSTSLKEQNWTAIWIEFVLLVAGVFIGIQVANWNEARRDRVLARQYLERLREDFVLSVSGAEDSNVALEKQAGLASLMLERLRACRLDDRQRDAFAEGLYRLGRQEPPMLTRGTLDELGSTGRLGIIRSVRLRRALSKVVQRQERTAKVFDIILARRTQPLGYIDARSTFLVPEHYDGPLKAGQILFDFQALCGDPVYINAVSHLRQSVYVVIGQNRALIGDYLAMVKQLDAELAKQSD